MFQLHQLDAEGRERLVRTPVGESGVVCCGTSRWKIDREDRTDGSHWIRAELVEGGPTHALLTAEVAVDDWTSADYLLLPGAVYAGNRFRCLPMPYSPRMPAGDCRPDIDTVVTDITRLEADLSPAEMELLAGDLAMPMAAVWQRERQQAMMVTFGQGGVYGAGENGIRIAEDLSRKRLALEVQSPGVRRKRYRHMERFADSPDRAPLLREGECLELEVSMVRFRCPDIPALFARVFQWQREQARQHEHRPTVPFAEAFARIAGKYERENWMDEPGLFASDPHSEKHPYQNGWCGGMHAVWALLDQGQGTVREHAARAFRSIINGRSPGDLFYGKYNPAEKCWAADGWNYVNAPHYREFCLIRRQGDTLYYGLKAFACMTGKDAETALLRWALEANASALCRIWESEGQFGQFVNQENGRVEIGGTACGAIVVAALAEAASCFSDARCARVARETLRAMDAEFLRKGVCTGGVGDALQAPDSESTAALLEAAMALFRLDGAREWIDVAIRAAHQLASWVMPYNYRFPESSEFGRLGMTTLGTVFANAQNKHSAPGLCTHSGLPLLELYEATGEIEYLLLLKDISRAIPQYLSREERPIRDPEGRPLPDGWINERVNTSDWDDNPGGVFFGSCWCEISMLLSYAELPGVYVDRDSGELVALDHVEVGWADAQRQRVELHNPTGFNADVRVRIRVEGAAEERNIRIEAGETVEFALDEPTATPSTDPPVQMFTPASR